MALRIGTSMKVHFWRDGKNIFLKILTKDFSEYVYTYTYRNELKLMLEIKLSVQTLVDSITSIERSYERVTTGCLA